MDPVKILLAHPPSFLAEEIVKLRARVAELEAELGHYQTALEHLASDEAHYRGGGYCAEYAREALKR